MKYSKYIIPICCLLLGCFPQKPIVTIISKDLDVLQLSKNVYIHSSYMNFPRLKRFSCNGLIYVHQGEAFIFDTPYNEYLTSQLISWLQKDLKVKVKGVIANHFHKDCIAGLDLFHQLEIPSYSLKRTQELAPRDSLPVPKIGFDTHLTLKLGEKRIVCDFLGEAHAPDNIVCWLPDEKLLFGGCMVKALKARKGNLADANLKEWANTIQKIKTKYATTKVVVPGHGQYGGMDLLDYTIALFSD